MKIEQLKKHWFLMEDCFKTTKERDNKNQRQIRRTILQGRVTKCHLDKTLQQQKLNFSNTKNLAKLQVMVQKILDDKRKVLLKNIEEMIRRSLKARGGIWDPLQDIYKSVNEAYLALGTNYC